MKSKMLSLLLLSGLLCFAFPPQAHAQSIAVGCGAVIDHPGVYHLSGNLSCPLGYPPPAFCDAAAITINAPHVVLNGRNLAISGGFTGVGIRITSSDVVVRDLEVDSFDIGMEIENGSSHLLERLNVHTNDGDYHCGNGIGVRMTNTTDNTIVDSQISSNERWGVTLDSSNENRLIGNSIINNYFRPGFEAGNIRLWSSHRNQIRSNDLSKGGIWGISLSNSNQNIVSANLFDETGTPSFSDFGTSIALSDSMQNLVDRNVIDRVPSQLGTFSGIALDSASQNVLRGNFVAHQPGGGIVLASTTTENRIIENTAVDNAPFDAEDDNPNCGTNVWRANQFDMVSQTCVR